jgi:hypothetical protein
MLKFKAVLVGTVLIGSLWVGSSAAHAALPCPEGMSGGTTVWLTYGSDNPTMYGATSNTGVRCTRDGHLVLVSGGRVAGGAPAEPARPESSALGTPCNSYSAIYLYFEGGFFHCSKDGELTYHLVA